MAYMGKEGSVGERRVFLDFPADCSKKVIDELNRVSANTDGHSIAAMLYLNKAKTLAREEGSYRRLACTFNRIEMIIGAYEDIQLASILHFDPYHAKFHLDRCEERAKSIGIYDDLAPRIEGLKSKIGYDEFEVIPMRRSA